MKPYTKKLVLENGTEFYGYGFGANREVIHEVVFNTSMVGY
ncbi:MAG: carbamoyl-phosphate synthase domain-containing protein, partial [Bacteroidales bacterium]|nr:carbamoyl-phosphate synthase domain-containing protein [Bacteroidales bacterium]